LATATEDITESAAKRVLILDDEPGILEVLSQHLSGAGYDCTTTTSPSQALDFLHTEHFALLLTDLRMPEMDGLEVVRRARTIVPDLSIIVVTALAEVTQAIQCMRLGAEDYVLKPFNLQDISRSVARAVEKQQAVTKSHEYQERLRQRVDSATTELEHVNQELRETKQYLENLLESTVDGIITIGKDETIEFANGGALAMAGYRRDDFLGLPVAELLAGGRDEFENIQRLLNRSVHVKNYETGIRKRDGSTVPVNISFSRVEDARGEFASILAICKDITEQKRLEQELKEMSVKDSLTGLYNQRSFFERLESEVERARRQKRPLSLLLFDIDKFKHYNDSRGHLEGDKVLRGAGNAVLECTREHVDIGFRYGGDEFTVILPEADEAQASAIAERIRDTFKEFHFDDLTLSIGCVSFREGLTVRSFIEKADALMYKAKRAGGNRVCKPAPAVEMPK
jgi:diguanylate cyclase (GGDEF)-like protein/PAS domain S-box-containing protein